MPNLADIKSSRYLQDTYTNTIVLAANVSENFTVPTDSRTGLKASYVRFGKPAAGDFYARAYTVEQGTDRATNGTFAEYVTNGTFTTDSDWTLGDDWSIAAGVATHAAGAESEISQTLAIALIPGYTYTLTFTTSSVTAGSIVASVGGVAGTPRTTSATFKETFVAGSTSELSFLASDDFDGSIDNVTITAWTLGTGWTTGSGVATATGAISTALSQTANYNYPLVAGQSYIVTYTATRSAGTVTVNIGGTAGTTRSSSATFTEVILAGSTQAISFTTSGFTGTIDDVSIIAAAAVPVDSTSGQSAFLNPEGLHLPQNSQYVSVVSAGTPTITASFYAGNL